MFYKQHSKASIKDLALDYPRKLEELQRKIDQITRNAAILPTLDKIINNYIENINEEKTELMDDKSLSILNKLGDELEATTKELINLASSKMELLEAARLRKATIRTGNLKEKIETEVPDTKLIKMLTELTAAYKKLNDLAQPLGYNQILQGRLALEGIGGYLGYSGLKVFSDDKLEVKGKHLNDMFKDVLNENAKYKRVAGHTVKYIEKRFEDELKQKSSPSLK